MGKLLSNPAFYHALAAFATSTGVIIGPGQMGHIVAAGAAFSGVIHAVTVFRTHF